LERKRAGDEDDTTQKSVRKRITNFRTEKKQERERGREIYATHTGERG